MDWLSYSLIKNNSHVREVLVLNIVVSSFFSNHQNRRIVYVPVHNVPSASAVSASAMPDSAST